MKYTASMEGELDEIEDGKVEWRVAMAEFYNAFHQEPGTRRANHDGHQAHGGADGPDLREVRQAAW